MAESRNISVLNGHHEFCHCGSCWKKFDESCHESMLKEDRKSYICQLCGIDIKKLIKV